MWLALGPGTARDPRFVLDNTWCSFSLFGFSLHICFTLPSWLFLLWPFLIFVHDSIKQWLLTPPKVHISFGGEHVERLPLLLLLSLFLICFLFFFPHFSIAGEEILIGPG